MLKRNNYGAILVLFLSLFFSISGLASTNESQHPPSLSENDVTRIGEAYHLWQSVGEKLWTGWTTIEMPFLYITPDYEYAISFPKTLEGFQPLGQNSSLKRQVQVRKRVLDQDLSASSSVQGVPAIIFGTPAALEKSSTEWVLTVIHEMFHVLQAGRGETKKVSALDLGSTTDASWQLNYPFPYKDADVMRLIHLQSYPIYLAVTGKEEAARKYDAATGVEAIRVYKSYLRNQAADNRFYKYSQFQETTEGIAFFTEYKAAELAVSEGYQPLPAFQQLWDFKSYRQVWEETYKNRIFLAKHAGHAARSRTAFYHLGLGKGLLLDQISPDWKSRYFAPGVWIDDLLLDALGQPSELPALALGAPAPNFDLPTATGEIVSLNQYRGKVLVVAFWQTWCLPCVDEIPYLQSLKEKYKGEGLEVVGISDRLDRDGIQKVRQFVRERGVKYPALIDEKGLVASEYNVAGYPHVFVIDREGRLAYDKRSGKDELEQGIRRALNGESALKTQD